MASEFDYDDPVEHGMTLLVDAEGWHFARCECGWHSNLAWDEENAERFYDDHITTLDDNE